MSLSTLYFSTVSCPEMDFYNISDSNNFFYLLQQLLLFVDKKEVGILFISPEL